MKQLILFLVLPLLIFSQSGFKTPVAKAANTTVNVEVQLSNFNFPSYDNELFASAEDTSDPNRHTCRGHGVLGGSCMAVCGDKQNCICNSWFFGCDCNCENVYGDIHFDHSHA